MNNKFFAILIFIMFSCKNDDRNFVEVNNLDKFPKTKFLVTLENNISDDKNAIYCATLPFAWKEITEVTGKPTKINKDYIDLILLNDTKSFINVLDKNEYESSVEIEENVIKAYVYFKKSLPFEYKLKSYENKLKFNGIPVKSFGLTGHDEFGIKNLIKILYYKNDNNFIIKLFPSDKNHEIILFKSEEKFSSMSEMNEKIHQLKILGKNEEKDSKLVWKYQLKEEDSILIPKINFNIITNYPTLEEKAFNGFDNSFKIESVIQRTAFLLDESGAEMESGVEFAVAAETEIIDEQPKPKHMIFDKPFLLLLKRTNSKNPYFGLWNSNAELIIK